MVKLENNKTNEQFEDQSDVLINAIGNSNKRRWPLIPRLRDYKGKLLYSAVWDQNYGYEVLLTQLAAQTNAHICSRARKLQSSVLE